MIQRSIFFPTLALVTLLAQAAISEPTQSSKNLRVGVVLSMSGEAAKSGEAIRKGIGLAQAELEGRGWQVELNFQDAQTKAAKAISSFQYLLAQDYKLLIGPTWSFEIKAVKPILEAADAVSIAPAGSSDINGGPSDSIFNLYPVRSRQLDVLTAWLKARTFKRAFVLTPLGDWGGVHREVFSEALRHAQVELVGMEEFDYGIEPAALKSLFLRQRSKKVDLLLATGGASDLASMLKVRKDLKWRVGFLTTEDLWDVIDNGILSPQSVELRDAWVLGSPLTGSFFERFVKLFNETPKVYADRGYDSLMLLAAAVDSGNHTSEGIRQFLYRTVHPDGASGPIRFGPGGDRISGEYRVMDAFDNKARK